MGNVTAAEQIITVMKNEMPKTVLTTEVCKNCGTGPLTDCGNLGWCHEYKDKAGSLCASWYCEPWEKYKTTKHQPTENEIEETIKRLTEAQDEDEKPVLPDEEAR